ncbi:class I SAM-dependent methyltransferase [Mycobacterium mantenii]|uniref:S-adenosyl-L-methionine-dependent methyltransferase n=1 Tax=Mycobacterium mantenii TaxID=560555 RepID=A0A1A2TXC1_MYCNT|nr:class I SAM-dependent methyltransferase [Mycobacterium mantenii]OBH40363.1 SAM-dependent methyltransferase [Mycobacterium mantenii]OBH51455.1 SAM-dependent methyltransferase [Mycobacterium mantenii]OBH71273.1 SAM-dependent methyltransferase [Mycobacterium mantenii]OBH81006.1 SAM-dependent methyltransferase [Mycobacterium mantenii]
MARTDDDSWEITESVGATALGVAAARAAETESENPLISDPFARVFLQAAGEGMWDWFAAPNLPAQIAELEPDLKPRMQGMVDYMAARTAFFDKFFLDAVGAGVRQVVILAAGLDSRAWRLPFREDGPDATTVYELDQPRVLDFKAATLRDKGAQPTCKLVNVPVDLRHDWPSALQQAGFDASAPSVWSAEGLLPFLPAAAQELLFDRVQALSAPGSRIAVEAPGPDFLDEEARNRQRQTMQRVRDLMAELDPERDIPDVQDLWYFEEREDVGDWLGRHGWEVTVTPAPELMAGYGRRPPQGIDDATPQTLFVAAQRTGGN